MLRQVGVAFETECKLGWAEWLEGVGLSIPFAAPLPSAVERRTSKLCHNVFHLILRLCHTRDRSSVELGRVRDQEALPWLWGFTLVE